MKEITEYRFPEDLHTMKESELTVLAEQIREFLLRRVSRTGGHLASNLGVVELSIALHRVFDSPKDRILWDVGHQSYVHKILTGRADEFDKLRQYNGISGFPKRGESEHDVYDSGHSSDSLSVAMGIAKARDLNNESFEVIDVIGDGAMTGGVAYEALNNGASMKAKVIIVLNDNQMSISPNVGGMTQHLGRIRVSTGYIEMKKKIQESLRGKGAFGEGIFKSLEKARDALKYTIFEKCIFENLGYKYYGPVDGHNISELTEFFEAAKSLDEPVVIHVVTKKGKGIKKIEDNSDIYHGIGPFNIENLRPLKKSEGISWSAVFGNYLTEMSGRDCRIAAVTAAMLSGTGLDSMKEKYPERTFDVGIAEQHATGFAAGLALQGMRPFVAVYSTFLQRAYDEIVMDVCLQNLPVVFCVDRAGNVGSDGETHNGQFDLSYLSHMPNMTVMAPSNDRELMDMMEYTLELNGPCAIRYPRGECPMWDAGKDEYLPIDGRCSVIREGGKVLLAAVGKAVHEAVKAGNILTENGIDCSVVNARFVKPLDEAGIIRAAEGKVLIVTMEDNVLCGGFGSMINSLFAGLKNSPEIINIGWPDEFIPAGNTEELMRKYGLDGESAAERIMEII